MQTTIILKGKDFPLYETKRGAYDFEKHGFAMKDIAEEKASALMAYVFFSAKACAKREKLDFPYLNLDGFIDDEDVDMEAIAKAFIGIVKADEKTEEPGEAKPEQPAKQ